MAPVKRKASRPVRKRLVVACDGTWMDLDRAAAGIWPSWFYGGVAEEPLVTTPTNVTRICRAIAHDTIDGMPQVVYYSKGVGSGQSWSSRFFGGVLGRGVDEHIREAYAFIQSNWNEGDEIVLLGFSRGAFTARSIGAFLSAAGVLTRIGMEDFQNIFEDWECQLYDGFQSHWPPDIPIAKRPSFRNAGYAALLEERGMTRLNIPIKAVAVWDTVGSLGIPDIGPFAFRKRLTFIDSEVSPSIEYAFQALALDEERKSFSPTIWESPSGPSRLKLLQQCWFPGVHSNIGSGYQDTEIADLTLSWMISKLDTYKILEFLPDAIIEQRQLGVKWIADSEQGIALERWGFGTLYNSMTSFYLIGGKNIRQPGRTCRTDPKTGENTPQRLSGTHESVHPSVRIRIACGGKGVGNRKFYQPKSLEGWEVTKKAGRGRQPHIWRSEFKGDYVELPEEKLEGLELDLLKTSPAIYEIYTNQVRKSF